MTLHSFQWAMLPASAGGEATLSWDAASPTPDGYHVYGKKTTDVYYTLLATTTNTSVTVTGLASGTWDFYVASYDSNGDSAASFGNATKVIP